MLSKETASYMESMSGGSVFVLTGDVVKSDGNQFFVVTENFHVGAFSGKGSLPIPSPPPDNM